ncbi:PTS system cellobiose-specific transporter subunit IIC [Endozoicomonas montiporae CL-33]|uniref:PTS system cellobiose-specific transporter subunit IIC n=2 Tax=Endozoicomonas montiporae TaxID=1027273 RepID=A0A142BEE8_9GAMM|nr:PTS system cellobiose-specific transporter subunit IIC [Endozoicomonas montiporae CL-33]
MYSEWYTNLMAEHKGNWLQPFYATLGMSCLFISFGIGSSLGKQYGLPEVTSGFLSLFAFLMVAAPVDGWPPAINASYLDSKGMFTAIVFSYLAIEVYRFMQTRNMTIRLPEQVPPAIARSFESLTPVIALILILQPLNLLVASVGEGGMLVPQLMMEIFKPLVSAADSLPGLLFIVLLVHVLRFCGLHGANIVTGVIGAIMLTNLSANQAALEAGEALPAIFAGGFLDSFVYLGGSGATLGLAIAMSISKSAHLRSIGRLSVVPGLFNINEPVLFGAPIVMNPILGIPFIVVPLINVTVAYLATSLDLVGRVVALVPWTTPGPLAAFLGTNFSISALILSLALVAFSTVAYLPFLRVYAKSLESQEQSEAQGEAVPA